jgi:hypothetical protein
MLIAGKWHSCEDGATRPAVEGLVTGLDGHQAREAFLIDSCSDCTVLSADLLHKLKLPGKPPPPGLAFKGIGGAGQCVVVSTVIEFLLVDGGPARIRGTMAAFTDPSATDLSILGRDVLDNFDVIISRRRNEVLLLAGNHHYHVSPANPNGK